MVMVYERHLYGQGGPEMLFFITSPLTTKFYRNNLYKWLFPPACLWRWFPISLLGHQARTMKANVWDPSGGVLCLLSGRASRIRAGESGKKHGFWLISVFSSTVCCACPQTRTPISLFSCGLSPINTIAAKPKSSIKYCLLSHFSFKN